MRFKPFGRYEFNDTSRKRAAYRRKLQAERDALPLFADQVAAEQTPVDEEMAGRRECWDRRMAADRQHQADKWREARRRLASYPEPIRTALKAYWQGCKWPADPTYLLSMLHMHDTKRLDLSAYLN